MGSATRSPEPRVPRIAEGASRGGGGGGRGDHEPRRRCGRRGRVRGRARGVPRRPGGPGDEHDRAGDRARKVAPSVQARGATLLDAPVSGSVPVVERGELLIMVGGDADALDRARPVLEALSSTIIHVGELGTGATMKLAVNALVHGLNAALSESLVLAERAGVDRTTAYEVFASGAAAAPFVLYKRAAFERPDETPVAFSLDLVGKDLDLILALAGRWVPRCRRRRRTGKRCEPPSRPGWPIETSAPWPDTCEGSNARTEADGTQGAHRRRKATRGPASLACRGCADPPPRTRSRSPARSPRSRPSPR